MDKYVGRIRVLPELTDKGEIVLNSTYARGTGVEIYRSYSRKGVEYIALFFYSRTACRNRTIDLLNASYGIEFEKPMVEKDGIITDKIDYNTFDEIIEAECEEWGFKFSMYGTEGELFVPEEVFENNLDKFIDVLYIVKKGKDIKPDSIKNSPSLREERGNSISEETREKRRQMAKNLTKKKEN